MASANIARRTSFVLSLLSGVALSATAAPPEGKPLETGPDDAPVVAGPGGSSTSPRAIIPFGSVTHLQVNLDDLGLNIVDDAGNEPSFAVDPTAPNRMVAGWRQFDTTSSNFRQAGYAYSNDGGRTWSGHRIIEEGLFRSDPVLGAGEDGTFYYLSLRVTDDNQYFCDMFVSTDHGVTWPVKSYAFGGDKAWFAIDTTGGLGHGNFYQPWNVAGNLFWPRQFNRSQNGGVAWEEPVEYDDDGTNVRPTFGILDVGPNGSVYVAGCRNSSNSDQFWVVRSYDAQEFFIPSFPQRVEVEMGGNLRIGQGPNAAGLLGQVEIKVDKSDGATRGNVYVLCSVDPPGDDPMDVHFVRSEDGGVNWSTPVRVNDDVNQPGVDVWQWFGTMGLAPNGRIDVIWNDTRHAAGANNVNELYYSFSDDGGLTWSVNEQLSPAWNSHIGWPNQNKIGDYYQLISDDVGAHLIWAATFNGEQDVYYTRIGDYDCNSNGVGDAIDIADLTSPDCNDNGIPDECEIAAEAVPDVNGNGIPDACETCPADFDGSGDVGFSDLLYALANWGPCGAPCPADLDESGDVGFSDLLVVLGSWGDCV